MRYELHKGFNVKGDVQSIGRELDGISKANGGQLTRRLVVKAAKPKRSILHQNFEWDDVTAADQWRRNQAGYLIRAVVICADEDEDFKPVRAWIAVDPEVSGDERHFVHIKDVIADPKLSSDVLQEAKDALLQWRRRYDHLSAFIDLYPAIDRALGAL